MSDDTHITRRAPHMERYVKVVPYPTEANPDACKVVLSIGVQSFTLSDGVDAYFETKLAAEWTRDMLCIALHTLVDLERQRGLERRFDSVSPPISELAQRAQEKEE